ncbi:MAG TPA: sulfotransferase family protein [Kofleriaceae bacterium]|nr:sulfotransferase family protein [Kofleriaceae bacterium]
MHRDFDCILVERHAAVYVEIPKVACTSVKTALAPACGVTLPADGNPHDLRWPLADGPPFPGRFSFAFVRDPWDRLVSCYRDKLRGEVDGFTSFTVRPGVANCLARFDRFVAGMSFAAFVRAVAAIPDAEADAHFRSQHGFVCVDGALAVDAIGRFERLDEDFAAIARRIGLATAALPRLQAVRAPSPFAAFYTAETRDLVAERFARDIELFGYAPPALTAASPPPVTP